MSSMQRFWRQNRILTWQQMFTNSFIRGHFMRAHNFFLLKLMLSYKLLIWVVRSWMCQNDGSNHNNMRWTLKMVWYLKMMKKCFCNTESLAKKSSASIGLLLGGTVGGTSSRLLWECHKSAMSSIRKGFQILCMFGLHVRTQNFSCLGWPKKMRYPFDRPSTVVRSMILHTHLGGNTRNAGFVWYIIGWT